MVDRLCKNINEEAECKGLSYFCDWTNGRQCRGKSIEFTPLEQFLEKSGEFPKPTRTILLSKDCNDSDQFCEKIEDPNYINGSKIAKCAQSNTNSTIQTSLDINTQICCVQNLNGTEKKCITTPRATFIENAENCGAIDNESYNPQQNGQEYRYLCADILGNNNGQIYNGYCTWCDGIKTNKEYEIPQERKIQLEELGFLPKKNIQWNEGKRCSNYNECEVNNSELLWNECVWNESEGLQGVDPEILINKTPEEQISILETQGYCILNDSQKIIKNKCEKILENNASINYGRVFNPTGNQSFETPACTYKYNWTHKCLKENDQYFASNYLCTWCPNLQCKIGKQKDICSKVLNDLESQELIGFAGTVCDTNSNYGNIINPEEDVPPDCGCYLRRFLDEETSRIKDIQITVPTTITTSLLIGLIPIFLI